MTNREKTIKAFDEYISSEFDEIPAIIIASFPADGGTNVIFFARGYEYDIFKSLAHTLVDLSLKDERMKYIVDYAHHVSNNIPTPTAERKH